MNSHQRRKVRRARSRKIQNAWRMFGLGLEEFVSSMAGTLDSLKVLNAEFAKIDFKEGEDDEKNS